MESETEPTPVQLDFRGIPTASCPNCGSDWLKVPIMFNVETYEPAAWGTQGECFNCGTLLTVCTPKDRIDEIDLSEEDG